MKKRLSALAAITVLTALLSGCYPTGNEAADISRENPSNSSGEAQTGNIGTSSEQSASELTAKYESEQFTANLNLPSNVPPQVSAIKLKPRCWDNDKLREIFIGDKEITSKTSYISDGFPDEKRFVVYFGDNTRLIYEPMNISCECKDDISGVQSSIANLIDAKWLDRFSDEELKGFSKSDALSRVQNIIDELEITNVGEPVVRSVSAEKGNELMNGKTSVDKDGNVQTPPKLNDEDEFYLVTYPLVYNDIELSQHLKMNADLKKSHSPSYIKAIVTKNAIVEFTCSKIYESEFEVQENVSINFGAEDALNVLIKHYTETFQMSSATLLRCKLVYITSDVLDGQCRVFIPIWQFSGYEITEDEKNRGLSPERLHYDYVLPQSGEIYEELF